VFDEIGREVDLAAVRDHDTNTVIEFYVKLAGGGSERDFDETNITYCPDFWFGMVLSHPATVPDTVDLNDSAVREAFQTLTFQSRTRFFFVLG